MRPQEIAEVVLVTKQTGPRKHPSVRFLNEVLRVLAGTRQRPRGPVEAVDVISKPSRVELALHLFATRSGQRSGWLNLMTGGAVAARSRRPAVCADHVNRG